MKERTTVTIDKEVIRKIRLLCDCNGVKLSALTEDLYKFLLALDSRDKQPRELK